MVSVLVAFLVAIIPNNNSFRDKGFIWVTALGHSPSLGRWGRR